MPADPTRVWAATALGAVLLIAGTAWLGYGQWLDDLQQAQSDGATSLAQLGPLLVDALDASRYAEALELVQRWGRDDPMLAAIKLHTANGFQLAGFERATPKGGRIGFGATLPYGYQGRARLTLEVDLSGAVARARRLGVELAIGDLLLIAALIVAARLHLANRHAVRRYRTISAVNEALIADQGAADFLRTLCAAAAAEGGFELVWIGLRDERPVLRPAAVAGPAAGYAEGLELSDDPNVVQGQGPAGAALREARTVIVNDFLRATAATPWAARARRHGIRSSAALPLRSGDRIIGLLGLYGGRRGQFDAAERAMVEQMAGDISLGLEHRRRGLLVERSNARLRDILDGLLVFVCLTTAEGVVLEINRAPLRITRMTRDQAIGVALPDTFPFARSNGAQTRARAALARAAAGEVVRYDDVVSIADGGSITVDLTFAPLHGGEAAANQVVVSAVDITERQRLEARLQVELQRNRSYLRHAVNGVHVLDGAGRLVAASQSFCESLRYGLEELLGRDPTLWDARLDPVQLAAKLAELLGGERLRYETVHRRRDGSLIDVEIVASAFEVDGAPYIYCSARDLTEIKQLERELLDAATREQRRLGQEMHDGLGQELTAAALTAEALAARARRDGLGDAADLLELGMDIRRCIATARAIVRGLSPLAEVGENLAIGLAELAKRKAIAGVEIVVNADPATDLGLSVDARGHLFRIAQEALQNALKYARATRIDITLSVDAADICLSVGDDGVGMPAVAAGGYGMHTMRYRARALRGRLTIAPRRGGGTLVGCCVPRAMNA